MIFTQSATAHVSPLPLVPTKEESPVIAANLTSDVYNEANPPMDWADMFLLFPNEAFRHQMTMMVRSTAALPEDPSADELWKVTLFAKWYIDYFFVGVNLHHANKENIVFPWIETRAPIPLNESHDELTSMMQRMKGACESICQKGGVNCSTEIHLLKHTIPPFEKVLRSHFKKEEEVIPPLLRANFTNEETFPINKTILDKGGLVQLKTNIPLILSTMKVWVTPEFDAEFCKNNLPDPDMQLANACFLPDLIHYVIPMRDAPTLAKEPELKRVDEKWYADREVVDSNA